MNLLDVLLLAVVAVCVVLAHRSIRRQRRRGSTCCGSCAGCGRGCPAPKQ